MRTRVLIIAEAANPDWVSVPLIGWSLARALSRVADVHLVTQIRNRGAIVQAGLTEGRDFTVIDSEAIARPLWALGSKLRMGDGKGWTTMQAISTLSYPWFEHLVWRKFGAAIKAGDYDIVHRITPLSPTAVSSLARKCARAGVPFVIGPLNGGVPWPAEFQGARRQEREWLSYLRGLYKLIPGRRSMLTHTAAILAGSHHTASEIPAAYRNKVIWLPENGIDPVRFDKRPIPASHPLRACFIGRMVPYKGPDMVLEAAAPLLRDGRMTLEMIGDGPMMADLRAAGAGMRGLTFHGWVDHADVQTIAGGSAVLAFPSVREFGGGVVLEAMAMGLAPLIIDYAGPAELVAPDTGYKIPLGDRDTIIANLRIALARLAEDPDAVAATAARAQTRVAEGFTWSAKAEQVAEVYAWLLGRRVDRPDFTGLATARIAPTSTGVTNTRRAHG